MSAFKLARQWYVEGRRINLTAMAEELGVGRATLMRWVGNKELLLAEVLWSIYEDILDYVQSHLATHQPNLQGAEYLAALYSQMNWALVHAEPLQRFVRQDPRSAMRVLASDGGLPQRVVQSWQEMIEAEVEAGRIDPQLDAATIANYIVRIGEGLIYATMLGERTPDLQPADAAFRLFLTGRAD